MNSGFKRALLLTLAAASIVSCSGDKSRPATPSAIVGWWRGTTPAGITDSYYNFRSDGRFSLSKYNQTLDRVSCTVPSGQWEITGNHLRLEIPPDSVVTLLFLVADHDSSAQDTLSIRETESAPENVYLRIETPPVSLSSGCTPCYNVHGGTSGFGGDVRDGTWRIRTITYTSPENIICQQGSDTTVVYESICNLESEFQQGLSGFPIPIHCNFELNGGSYDLTCCGDTTIVGCALHMEMTASGVYTDTTYTFNARALLGVSGPTGLCPNAPCTLDVRETGVWAADSSDCGGATGLSHHQSLPGMKALLRWIQPH